MTEILDEIQPKSDPKAYWPLIRFCDRDFDDDPGAVDYFLTDGDMIMLKVLLRYLCQRMEPGDKFTLIAERIRHKIEQVVDLEFNEGRFADVAEDVTGGPK